MAKTKKKGFTLIEVVITMAVLAVFLSIVTSVFIFVLRGFERSNTLVALQQDCQNTLDRVTDILREGTGFNPPNLDSFPIACSVTNADGIVREYNIIYGPDDNTVRIERRLPASTFTEIFTCTDITLFEITRTGRRVELSITGERNNVIRTMDTVVSIRN